MKRGQIKIFKAKIKKSKKHCFNFRPNLNSSISFIIILILKIIIIIIFIIIFCFTLKTYKQNFIQLRKFLGLYNDNNYNSKYDSIIKIKEEAINHIDEEYKKMQKREKSDILISFTSYPKRFSDLPLMIYSLLRNTIAPYKIIMVLTEEDEKHLTPILKYIVNKGIVEILRAKENLRPHTKYYFTMINYKENPIVTVDDDVVYSKYLIEELLQTYKKFPKCIIGRLVKKKLYEKKSESELAPFEIWGLFFSKNQVPSFDLYAEGVGGVLYPPNILDIKEDKEFLKELKKFLTIDDVFLNYLEVKKGIKTVQIIPKDESSKENELYQKGESYQKDLLFLAIEEMHGAFGLSKRNDRINKKGVKKLLNKMHKELKLFKDNSID